LELLLIAAKRLPSSCESLPRNCWIELKDGQSYKHEEDLMYSFEEGKEPIASGRKVSSLRRTGLFRQEFLMKHISPRLTNDNKIRQLLIY
jgi:hypothetical protein